MNCSETELYIQCNMRVSKRDENVSLLSTFRHMFCLARAYLNFLFQFNYVKKMRVILSPSKLSDFKKNLLLNSCEYFTVQISIAKNHPCKSILIEKFLINQFDLLYLPLQYRGPMQMDVVTSLH